LKHILEQLTCAAILIVASAFVTSCKEDEPEVRGTVVVMVNDEFGVPLEGVLCTVTGTGEYSSTSGSNGQATIENVLAGNYQIILSKNNYLPATKEIRISREPAYLELALSSGQAFLQIKDSVFNVRAGGAALTVAVESNATWAVSSNVSWLTLSEKTGSGRGDIGISCVNSTEDAVRTGIITITCGTIRKKIRVNQDMPLKLLTVRTVLGNAETGVKDSIIVAFNKPVTLTSITPNNYLCLGEIKSKTYGRNVGFTYGCASMGASFAFSTTVKDGPDTYTFPFQVNFYNKKITVPGFVTNYIITDDNTTLWALLRFPNRLLKIALPDFTIQKQYDLNFQASSIRWNSYKNTLNIFGSGWCYTSDIVDGDCDQNYLMYIDPENFEIMRSEIPLISGYDSESNHPPVFPRALALFHDGTGLVQLVDEYQYNRWRYFNSGNPDETYISTMHTSASYDIRFQEMHTNYDKTKIYLMHPWGSTRIDVYEHGSPTFKTYTSPLNGRSNILISHKKANRVYHAQLYEQFVSDMDGYVSKISYLDTRAFYGGMDFSYKTGETETIYYLADGFFQVLDYQTAFTSFSTDALSNLSSIQSTTDGDYLVATRGGSSATEIFLFNIDELTKTKIEPANSSGRISSQDVPTQSVWRKN
jgi:hypothetical protein